MNLLAHELVACKLTCVRILYILLSCSNQTHLIDMLLVAFLKVLSFVSEQRRLLSLSQGTPSMQSRTDSKMLCRCLLIRIKQCHLLVNESSNLSSVLFGVIKG